MLNFYFLIFFDDTKDVDFYEIFANSVWIIMSVTGIRYTTEALNQSGMTCSHIFNTI